MRDDGLKADLPPTVYVAAALVALHLAVREAGRARAGDRRARPWFAFFLLSAAVLTVIGVSVMLSPQPAR